MASQTAATIAANQLIELYREEYLEFVKQELLADDIREFLISISAKIRDRALNRANRRARTRIIRLHKEEYNRLQLLAIADGYPNTFYYQWP